LVFIPLEYSPERFIEVVMETDFHLIEKMSRDYISNLHCELNFKKFHLRLSATDFCKMDMFRLQPKGDSSSNDMMGKAQHVWNMLDELASSDPSGYK
jgi:hypothetical protein